MFSVSPPKYSVIYSLKYALYLGKFWSRVWIVPGSLFRLPLIAKRCSEDEADVKVCIFWKCIQYTIHLDITQILKKFPSDKINGTKNALFFLSRAPTHHSFTFNLRFLYELKHKVRLSKTVCGIFYFRFHYVFDQSLYFYSTKRMDSLTLERHITPFKIKIIEKPRIVLLPDVWFF